MLIELFRLAALPYPS